MAGGAKSREGVKSLNEAGTVTLCSRQKASHFSII
jgi:hypothetical protein